MPLFKNSTSKIKLIPEWPEYIFQYWPAGKETQLGGFNITVQFQEIL